MATGQTERRFNRILRSSATHSSRKRRIAAPRDRLHVRGPVRVVISALVSASSERAVVRFADKTVVVTGAGRLYW